jgi:putative ABC transport system permease protein
MIHWLTQVWTVTLFSLRTIPERRGAALAAAAGIAGVVTVLVGVLSIAAGFQAAMQVSGPEDVAIVLRSGADTEMTSGLSREETRLILDAPGVARGAGGAQVSPELFVMINLPSRSTGADGNLAFRGVGLAGPEVRGDFRMVEGRRFAPGRNEIIVGAGAARAFAGLETGRRIRIGANEWEITGVFTGGSGAAESEIWTDGAVLQPAYNRGEFFQSVYARLASPAAFAEFKDALTSNPRLKVKVVRQADFLHDQSSMLTSFITGLGYYIAGLMGIGALFGALNTMYSAVSSRTREIATLRALGFGASPVVLSVLGESLALALLGGSAGAGAAYVAFDGFQASTLNWQTFSQIAFSFAVTPELLVQAVAWSACLGVLGGLFPAIRAARLPIAAALRET